MFIHLFEKLFSFSLVITDVLFDNISEVVEHEENVIDTDMNIVFENNYEELYKTNAASDNESEYEIETSQANSECIEEDEYEDEEDEEEDDDDNECPNGEDDDDEENEKQKNLNKNSQYYRKNRKSKPSKENLYQSKSKTNSNHLKSTYNKNTNAFEDDYEAKEWLNDDEDVDYKKYKSSCGLTVRQVICSYS